MASTYSTNLAIELIGTGDQAGSWGNTTNTNLGTLIEQAISGYVTQAVSTGTDTTITIPNGATGVARNMYIELTGTGGTNTNLIVPANKKLYFIFNNTTGAVTVKVSGQTGVSVPQGKKVVLTSNGTDIVNGLNYIADFGSNSATITQLTATSATITNLTLTSLVISNLSIASANITTLTSASATITNLLGTTLTISGNSFLATSSGNVGVGTTSPSDILTLAGGASGSYGLTINNAKVGGGTKAIFQYDATNQIALVGGNTTNGLAFQTLTGGSLTSKVWLDSSGNLGLGVTPSAWSGVGAALQVGVSAAIIGNSASSSSFVSNAYFDGTNYRYIGTGFAQRLALTSGAYSFQTAASGTAGGAITFTTGMTLTSAGDLGVGTTSPGYRLEVYKTDPTANRTNPLDIMAITANNGNAPYDGFGAGLVFKSSTYLYPTPREVARIRSKLNDNSALNYGSSLVFDTTPLNSSSPTQAMELNYAGNLGLGVIPSAVSASDKVVQVGAFLFNNNTNGYGILRYNNFFDGTNDKYINTGTASAFQMFGNAFRWYQAASGTAGNNISFGDPKMTLDANGNLLVGSGVSGARLSIRDGGSNDSYFGLGANYDVYISSGSSGTHYFRKGSSSVMTLDASGNLGVGVTSPTVPIEVQSNSGGTGIIIRGRATANSGTLRFYANNGTTQQAKFEANDTNVEIGSLTNVPFLFYANNAERGRFTAGGFFKASNTGTYASSTSDRHELRSDKNDINVLVSTTSTGASVVNVYSQFPASPNADAYHFAGVISGSGYQFTVDADGDVKNTNGSYAAISDLKLKQDIEDAASQWDDIKSVRVRKYRFKRTPDAPLQIGVIAQELEQTSPGLVSEDADRDEENNDLGTTTKSVKYSILYMKAVKALQEAMARIEQLEAKVAALEAK